MRRSVRIGGTLALASLALFVVVQVVPYGRAHDNPPVVREPAWDRPETRAVAKIACFDCHSHETEWPLYSHVAPFSWLGQRDVDGGRRELNFSEWGSGRDGEEPDELAEKIRSDEMPLPVYLIAHAEARLSDARKQRLLQGLMTTASGGGNPWPEHAEPEADDD
jgi:hypothetical protein